MSLSMSLFLIVVFAVVFFVWRNFMKNKEYAVGTAVRVSAKNNLELLDDTVCLRKIKTTFEDNRLVYYRIYSFDYNNTHSAERFRGYIVLRNGHLYEVEISDFERADLSAEENITTVKPEVIKKSCCGNNIISFDE